MSSKMKMSPRLFLLVAVVVMIFDRVPSAEGLQCHKCQTKGRLFPKKSRSTSAKQQIGKEDQGLPDLDELADRLSKSMKCENLTKSTKKDRTNVDICPSHWRNPWCATHDTYGRFCTTYDIYATRFVHIKVCRDDTPIDIDKVATTGTICGCNDKDFCNDQHMAADSMSTNWRIVVALLGVTWLVQRY